MTPRKQQNYSGDNLHPADQTSYPGPSNPPIDRPPYSTTRPDVPIVGTMTEGAGARNTGEDD